MRFVFSQEAIDVSPVYNESFSLVNSNLHSLSLLDYKEGMESTSLEADIIMNNLTFGSGLESATDKPSFFKRIWEAIKNFFKAIWEYVTSFFKFIIGLFIREEKEMNKTRDKKSKEAANKAKNSKIKIKFNGLSDKIINAIEKLCDKCKDNKAIDDFNTAVAPLNDYQKLGDNPEASQKAIQVFQLFLTHGNTYTYLCEVYKQMCQSEIVENYSSVVNKVESSQIVIPKGTRNAMITAAPDNVIEAIEDVANCKSFHYNHLPLVITTKDSEYIKLTFKAGTSAEDINKAIDEKLASYKYPTLNNYMNTVNKKLKDLRKVSETKMEDFDKSREFIDGFQNSNTGSDSYKELLRRDMLVLKATKILIMGLGNIVKDVRNIILFIRKSINDAYVEEDNS